MDTWTTMQGLYSTASYLVRAANAREFLEFALIKNASDKMLHMSVTKVTKYTSGDSQPWILQPQGAFPLLVSSDWDFTGDRSVSMSRIAQTAADVGDALPQLGPQLGMYSGDMCSNVFQSATVNWCLSLSAPSMIIGAHGVLFWNLISSSQWTTLTLIWTLVWVHLIIMKHIFVCLQDFFCLQLLDG